MGSAAHKLSRIAQPTQALGRACSGSGWLRHSRLQPAEIWHSSIIWSLFPLRFRNPEKLNLRVVSHSHLTTLGATQSLIEPVVCHHRHKSPRKLSATWTPHCEESATACGSLSSSLSSSSPSASTAPHRPGLGTRGACDNNPVRRRCLHEVQALTLAYDYSGSTTRSSPLQMRHKYEPPRPAPPPRLRSKRPTHMAGGHWQG